MSHALRFPVPCSSVPTRAQLSLECALPLGLLGFLFAESILYSFLEM